MAGFLAAMVRFVAAARPPPGRLRRSAGWARRRGAGSGPRIGPWRGFWPRWSDLFGAPRRRQAAAGAFAQVGGVGAAALGRFGSPDRTMAGFLAAMVRFVRGAASPPGRRRGVCGGRRVGRGGAGRVWAPGSDHGGVFGRDGPICWGRRPGAGPPPGRLRWSRRRGRRGWAGSGARIGPWRGFRPRWSDLLGAPRRLRTATRQNSRHPVPAPAGGGGFGRPHRTMAGFWAALVRLVAGAGPAPGRRRGVCAGRRVGGGGAGRVRAPGSDHGGVFGRDGPICWGRRVAAGCPRSFVLAVVASVWLTVWLVAWGRGLAAGL
jgi:hypothetical protein